MISQFVLISIVINVARCQTTPLPNFNADFSKILAPKNHWSFNGNYNDEYGSANLVPGSNFSLTFDRYGNPNSALSLNNGFMKVPGGKVYFAGDFTFITWIYWRQTKNWARIIDFGNGSPDNNIQVCSSGNTNKLFVGIAQGKNDSSFKSFIGSSCASSILKIGSELPLKSQIHFSKPILK